MAAAMTNSGDDDVEKLGAVRRPRAASWTSDDGAFSGAAGGSGVTAGRSANARILLETIREEGIGASPVKQPASSASTENIPPEL